MNERILEFAKQTGLCDADGDFFGGKISQYNEFAELIVRECGILADQYNFEKNRGTINPFKTTAYEFIKQHFGVE